jgi:diguanylate cyclase (GGDEF)-like protein
MAIRPVVSLARRSVPLGLAVVALAVVLSAVAVGIVHTRNQSKGQIRKNFTARGENSAEFVSTFLSQQAVRQRSTAQRFLAAREVGPQDFTKVVATFGSDSAVLLDQSGGLLRVVPSAPKLLGSRIAPRYRHLTTALTGRTAVSGVVPSAGRGEPVVAVAAPFATPHGRRVFSVAYPVDGSVLAAFVAHTTTAKQHLVMLVDASGNVIADDPRTSGGTLRQQTPALADAVARGTGGTTNIAGKATTFVVAPVKGTGWRVVIAVPDERLFASISGMSQWGPWIIFAVIAALALIVLALFVRSIVSHDRLETLSSALADAARTDVLTALPNRRSLEERMPDVWAHAIRHQRPLSVLMIDLDHFKQINDTCGHATGDALLKAVADSMRTVFRQSDVFGRWGGDEFIAILPETDHDGAHAAGERLSEQARSVDVTPYGLKTPLALSIGWSSGLDVPENLIAEADESLYQAKRDGRGRVVGKPLVAIT